MVGLWQGRPLGETMSGNVMQHCPVLVGFYYQYTLCRCTGLNTVLVFT